MTREELLALKIKPINKKIEKEVKAIWDGIAKPLDGMGEFELLLARIGGILESTDLNLQKKAIMLSGETAAGKYPVEAVRTMSRIAKAAEDSIDYGEKLTRLSGRKGRCQI